MAVSIYRTTALKDTGINVMTPLSFMMIIHPKYRG